MTFKKITVKKTPTGYSVSVFVRDGKLVKPLYFGIQRFFDELKKVENKQSDLDKKDPIMEDLKEALGIEKTYEG